MDSSNLNYKAEKSTRLQWDYPLYSGYANGTLTNSEDPDEVRRYLGKQCKPSCISAGSAVIKIKTTFRVKYTMGRTIYTYRILGKPSEYKGLTFCILMD